MTRSNGSAVLTVRPRAGFVETLFVRELTTRALAYIDAGYPVHFRGPSGSGKTTMAMHVAHHLGRPIMLICGDDQFGTSDLVGGQHGYRRRKVVDNFVHSVLKTEEDVAQEWVDSRLTQACRDGLTLVYDEFNRSRPEANNVLLSVLEEKILVMPAGRNGSGYLKAHADFVTIFTSNPDDYAGVHGTQDALRDRMVTIDLDYFDRETEIEIVRSRSGLTLEDVERIVDLVRAYRASGIASFSPTVRCAVMIAKVVAIREASVAAADAVFEQICLDVLGGRGNRANPDGLTVTSQRDAILDLMREDSPGASGAA